MDDTENYLNSILKKRLGSVVNYNGSSKTANTVTRIPKQQQKTQHMPTVFRKKHQSSVYIQTGYPNETVNNASHCQRPQSQYMLMKETVKSKEGQEMQEEGSRQGASQRVQYMLISKRIQNLKEDEPIMPTVDVTNYHHPVKSTSYYSTPNSDHLPHHNVLSSDQSYQLQSRLSSNNTNLSKRKRIFGAQ